MMSGVCDILEFQHTETKVVQLSTRGQSSPKPSQKKADNCYNSEGNLRIFSFVHIFFKDKLFDVSKKSSGGSRTFC